ncbi:MAG: hypothetical protein A2912_03335 [Candidatus Buchananbacteria bacterium RIFCSPLOWO2_01_FULL_40_23b]|uniref:Uncharacterized protein n=1 Tax=Candidatus Buchananbacteria bacterium RIFCSPLOWO2_01_FULL_40_23b TaxID=1797544 RepID=A0A1G1YUF2_9BACT|nr:MAG: hypothetical protein A2912_03335 [Candidatus Buchananbacteria bacterium RIFCSPLOWO2_01_FULL_40_23b]
MAALSGPLAKINGTCANRKEEDMSSYKEGQTHQLANALEAEGFTPEEVTALGQNRSEALTGLRLVLRGLAKIVRECFKLECQKSFSPEEFIGKGWTVWKGQADGNGLEGEEDRDTREDTLSVIDWEQVLLEDHLQEGEPSVHGEEKLRRAIASGNINLGGRAFLSLWEDYQTNRESSVLEKLRRKGVTRIYFFGLRLRDPIGDRRVLCLYVYGSQWRWDYYWLGSHWNARDPSASLASN